MKKVLFVLFLALIVSSCASTKKVKKVNVEPVEKVTTAEGELKQASLELLKIRNDYLTKKNALTAEKEEFKTLAEKKKVDFRVQAETIDGLYNDYKAKLKEVQALTRRLNEEFK